MAKYLPDDVLIEAVNLRNKHKTLRDAAIEAKLTWSAFENRLRRAAERGLDGSIPEVLPLGQVVKGVSTLWKKCPNGQWDESLVWVKSKNDEDLQEWIKAIGEAFDTRHEPAKLIAAPKQVESKLLSVYPIADQHIGLMSWGKETGEDYDLEIGAARLRSCAARLISQSPNSKQALILNLGDYIHNDDGRNVTPHGLNPLDVDGRYFKVLVTGVQLMQDVIEMALQKHDTVLVRNLPGNHDPHASIALTVALAAFYSKNPRVTIDQDPSEFFFHKFGQVLIGANHGHRMKTQDMAMVMATRMKEAWGQTKYRHFMYGHFHHEQSKEVGGVRTECFQTLTSQDAWSHSKGFVSGHSLTSITYELEGGEIGRHRVNL